MPLPENRAKQSTGVPRYIATFADLMTLLLCFFILLLTMAEIDALKYKMVVRSMENAFGVTSPETVEVLKGTSVIQQRFSSSNQSSSIFARVTQDADNEKDAIALQDAKKYLQLKRQAQYQELKKSLKNPIEKGQLNVEMIDGRVLIRINEDASFTSGSAQFQQRFMPVIRQIAAALSHIDGFFVVAGHTDDIPLKSTRYRSNWDLSAARATSVVHALLEQSVLKPSQFRIEGYADTKPLVANDTPQNRALNRRVEIGIIN